MVPIFGPPCMYKYTLGMSMSPISVGMNASDNCAVRESTVRYYMLYISFDLLVLYLCLNYWRC